MYIGLLFSYYKIFFQVELQSSVAYKESVSTFAKQAGRQLRETEKT